MAGFATRPSFAGHPGSGAKSDHELTFGVDHLWGLANHVGGFELPCHTDGQAFTGELVDDAQHPERLSVVGAISNEVVGPDMVGPLRAQTNARSIIEPQTPAFGLFCRDFQPLTSPDPLDTLLVHRPSGSAKQRRDPAISVAAVLAGKRDDVGS